MAMDAAGPAQRPDGPSQSRPRSRTPGRRPAGAGIGGAGPALRTEQNMSNELILQPRRGYWRTPWRWCSRPRSLCPGASPCPGRRARVRARLRGRPLPLRRPALIVLPALSRPCAGHAGQGRRHQVDRNRHYIVTCILLGWGLNIVVGLAGLLDLGYVAFYAVGAYAYAPPATSDPIKAFDGRVEQPASGRRGRSGSACASLASWRRSGASCWASQRGAGAKTHISIVTLAFREIIRLVLINWVPVTNGYVQSPAIPAPLLLRPAVQRQRPGFCRLLRPRVHAQPSRRLPLLRDLGLAMITNC